MKNNERSKSAVFLIEFLITLAVFSLACVVALRLYAKADSLQDNALRTDCASTIAATVAQELFLSGEDEQTLADYCAAAQSVSDGYSLYFSDSCTRCGQSEAAYMAVFSVERTEGSPALLNTEISVYAVQSALSAQLNDEPVYTLTAARYYPQMEVEQ